MNQRESSVWREKVKSNRICEWLGPFNVEDFDPGRKIIFVRDYVSNPATNFTVAQVKPYLEPEHLAHTLLTDFATCLSHFKSPCEDFTLVVEVLDPNDDCARGPEMTEAKKAEIRALLERGTFKVQLREEVPHDVTFYRNAFFRPSGRLSMGRQSTRKDVSSDDIVKR